MKQAFHCAALLLLLALAPSKAAAHYFWVAPRVFHAVPGELVSVQLRVGHPGEDEPFARDPVRIRRFAAVHPDGSQSRVAGRAGAEPAGGVRLREPGFHLIAYRSQRSVSVLEAQKFEAYLEEEGLERIIAVRAASGQRAREGREWYSRSAKALVSVAGGAEEAYRAGFDRNLGLQLELIPRSNPALFRPGEPFSLLLLFEGRPAAGVLIRAFSARSPADSLAQRTDAEGRVAFSLGQGGQWLFTGVHMIEAGAGAAWSDGIAAKRPAEDADWESFWASLALELP